MAEPEFSEKTVEVGKLAKDLQQQGLIFGWGWNNQEAEDEIVWLADAAKDDELPTEVNGIPAIVYRVPLPEAQ